jgi:hypothetical protein
LARPAHPLERAMSPLHDACRDGDTERVKQLLDGDGGAHVDKKDGFGMTALMGASFYGHTEVVRLLLDKGALLDEKGEHGRTALLLASMNGHTEVVRLLLDKGALLDEKDKSGRTALMKASEEGHTEVVRLLLDKGALLDEKDTYGGTALKYASLHDTEVMKLLLEKGASVDKIGDPALIAVTVKLLLDRADLFNPVGTRGDAALLALTGVDEDYLGRMAAAHTRRRLLQRTDERDVPASEVLATAEASTATAVLDLVRLARSAAARARTLRSSDPRSADDHHALFGRLQLAVAACVQNDESGEARGEEAVQELLRSGDGLKALQHAVEINAKELLAQPVVQGYVKVAWLGKLVSKLVDADDVPRGFAWILLFIRS